MRFRMFNRLRSSMILKLFSNKKNCDISTTGIIVVGDEILKGEVADTNSTYLAKELHKLGLQLKKICVIGDNIQEICDEVKVFSKTYDYVITTGGIGPTHDDVTYEGVAMAFNENLVLNPELRDICLKFYKTDNVNIPGMKLAYIPISAKLNYNNPVYGDRIMYPNVSVRNVYMFPGIPEFMMKSFNPLKTELFKSKDKFYGKEVYFNTTESNIVEVLNLLVKEYPNVQFGSYPKLFHKNYKVKVTIESCCEQSTIEAYNKLLKLLPKEYVANVEQLLDKTN